MWDPSGRLINRTLGRSRHRSTWRKNAAHLHAMTLWPGMCQGHVGLQWQCQSPVDLNPVQLVARRLWAEAAAAAGSVVGGNNVRAHRQQIQGMHRWGGRDRKGHLHLHHQRQEAPKYPSCSFWSGRHLQQKVALSFCILWHREKKHDKTKASDLTVSTKAQKKLQLLLSSVPGKQRPWALSLMRFDLQPTSFYLAHYIN